ncbi:competence-damage protein [Renibacterium salmoninarum ATCC 33209]|uniref:Competence-damage protein n=1 Tax=Renibacterium salmoninarum (strain ATCC 33209 / DSM 20767 / JCM 11484 / NBRC 15589 / NCIMB 2235) TaxID=288705 RepID=A9WQ39_RENSM|nr:CinA family protein [Renibacterium salmoninarum]ABY22465.1 competence-damage protein [Renibacterium salmoninarum ATCC 33209]
MTDLPSRVAPNALDKQKLVQQLKSRSLTLATAESLTGGALAAEFVSVPGVSAVYQGGVIAYQNSVKTSALFVSEDLLIRHGSVDAEVAGQMALGVCKAIGARVGISTTGAAGPEPHDGKPVGTVFIAVALDGKLSTAELHFDGDREAIRTMAVAEALRMLSVEVGSFENSSQESPGNVPGTKHFDG